MKYQEIYTRIERAAECVLHDILADEADPDVFQEEGRDPWDTWDNAKLAKEIGSLIGEQFLEVDYD